jgi:hypothetical protein
MSSSVAESLDTARPVATRRARFQRQDPPPLRLTSDDIAILRHVAEHRFLRSTHLVALMNRPAKKIVERLSALYHNAYLDRPRAQLDYYATAGSAPFVYALGNKGANVLAEIDDDSRPQVDRTTKNRSAGRLFIDHTLMIANLMIALELATRRRGDVRLIGPRELHALLPASARSAPHPWTLTAKIKYKGKTVEAKVIPDKVFGLEFRDTGKRCYFFVEADRGTMPIRRSHPRQTSYEHKLRTYRAVHEAGIHRDRLGLGNFRVLTITTSAARIASMREALQAITRGAGSNQFLFADRATLTATPDVFTLDWITGKGDTMRLLPDALY